MDNNFQNKKYSNEWHLHTDLFNKLPVKIGIADGFELVVIMFSVPLGDTVSCDAGQQVAGVRATEATHLISEVILGGLVVHGKERVKQNSVNVGPILRDRVDQLINQIGRLPVLGDFADISQHLGPAQQLFAAVVGLRGVSVAERVLTTWHGEVDDHAKWPHVGSERAFYSFRIAHFQDLRSDVTWVSGDANRWRYETVCIWLEMNGTFGAERCGGTVLWRVDRLGFAQTEVGDFDDDNAAMVAPQEDAIRPDVSVNDALAVQVADSGDQLAEYDPLVNDTAVHVVDQLVAVHSQVTVAQIRHYVSEICKFG